MFDFNLKASNTAPQRSAWARRTGVGPTSWGLLGFSLCFLPPPFPETSLYPFTPFSLQPFADSSPIVWSSHSWVLAPPSSLGQLCPQTSKPPFPDGFAPAVSFLGKDTVQSVMTSQTMHVVWTRLERCERHSLAKLNDLWHRLGSSWRASLLRP